MTAKILPLPDWAAPRRFSLEGRELLYRHDMSERVEELFACSVDELCESFQRFESFWDWMACWGHRSWQQHDLQSFADLWNLTARRDLEGYRPIELYLRALLVRGRALPGSAELAIAPTHPTNRIAAQEFAADEGTPIEDFGTRHVHSPITGELLRDDRLMTPAFFEFVEGNEPHGVS